MLSYFFWNLTLNLLSNIVKLVSKFFIISTFEFKTKCNKKKTESFQKSKPSNWYFVIADTFFTWISEHFFIFFSFLERNIISKYKISVDHLNGCVLRLTYSLVEYKLCYMYRILDPFDAIQNLASSPPKKTKIWSLTLAKGANIIYIYSYLNSNFYSQITFVIVCMPSINPIEHFLTVMPTCSASSSKVDFFLSSFFFVLFFFCVISFHGNFINKIFFLRLICWICYTLTASTAWRGIVYLLSCTSLWLIRTYCAISLWDTKSKRL